MLWQFEFMSNSAQKQASKCKIKYACFYFSTSFCVCILAKEQGNKDSRQT